MQPDDETPTTNDSLIAMTRAQYGFCAENLQTAIRKSDQGAACSWAQTLCVIAETLSHLGVIQSEERSDGDG